MERFKKTGQSKVSIHFLSSKFMQETVFLMFDATIVLFDHQIVHNLKAQGSDIVLHSHYQSSSVFRQSLNTGHWRKVADRGYGCILDPPLSIWYP